jgi:uncharacterized membrane protein
LAWSAKWVNRVPLVLFAVVFVVTALVFLVAGGFTGDWYRAWDVLIGAESPFSIGGSYDGIFFVLSLLGYLFVPAVIGIAAVDAIARFMGRRLKTVQDATDNIGSELTALKLTADNLKKQFNS